MLQITYKCVGYYTFTCVKFYHASLTFAKNRRQWKMGKNMGAVGGVGCLAWALRVRAAVLRRLGVIGNPRRGPATLPPPCLTRGIAEITEGRGCPCLAGDPDLDDPAANRWGALWGWEGRAHTGEEVGWVGLLLEPPPELAGGLGGLPLPRRGAHDDRDPRVLRGGGGRSQKKTSQFGGIKGRARETSMEERV